MRLAIEKAKEGIANAQSPFGACIVKDNNVIACSHNTVLASKNVILHAEINAIQEACQKLQTIDLSGSTIYSTCEPCPMCFTAVHWARISTIVYGATIADAKRFGFNELEIPNELIKKLGNSKMTLISGILHEECVGLFQLWQQHPEKRAY